MAMLSDSILPSEEASHSKRPLAMMERQMVRDAGLMRQDNIVGRMQHEAIIVQHFPLTLSTSASDDSTIEESSHNHHEHGLVDLRHLNPKQAKRIATRRAMRDRFSQVDLSERAE